MSSKEDEVHRRKLWELEAGNDFDKWASTLEQVNKLATIRKDVTILGEVIVERFGTFDELSDATGSKAGAGSKTTPLGHTTIDGIPVKWMAYYCSNCNISFLVPWERQDKMKVAQRGNVIASHKITIQDLVNRLACCNEPKPEVLIRRASDTHFNIGMKGRLSVDEFVLWTVPFDLVQKLSELDESLLVPTPNGVLDLRSLTIVAGVAFVIGLLFGIVI